MSIFSSSFKGSIVRKQIFLWFFWKNLKYSIIEHMKKIVFIVLGTTMADILTKWWAHIWSPDISLFGNILEFTYIRNTGIAFSTQLPYIHIIIPLILWGLLYFIFTSWKQISEKEKIWYILIITGWFLNALERSIFGSVTDFISVQYFAVFNIADIAITFGVLFLLFWNLTLKRISPKIRLQKTKK